MIQPCRAGEEGLRVVKNSQLVSMPGVQKQAGRKTLTEQATAKYMTAAAVLKREQTVNEMNNPKQQNTHPGEEGRRRRRRQRLTPAWAAGEESKQGSKYKECRAVRYE